METPRFLIKQLLFLTSLMMIIVACVEDPMEEIQTHQNQEFLEMQAKIDAYRSKIQAPSLKLAAPTTTPKYCYELTWRSDQNCDGYSNVLMNTTIFDSKQECWEVAGVLQMLMNYSEVCDEILVRCRTAECILDE